METGESEMPAGKTNASLIVSRGDTETLLGTRQGLEHDSNRSGLINERLEAVSGAEKTVAGLLPRSGRKKRSARSASNLRKSLAWDKAFSTDEGVLDVDELPLVTKTPRKPPELHLLDIPEILGKFSPAPHSALENHNPNAISVDRGEMITSILVKSSPRLESLSSGSPTSRNLEITPSNISSPVVALSTPDTRISKLDTKSSSSATEMAKANSLKGTRLRLPSTFTGKSGKSDMIPKPISIPESNFLRRCKSTSSILSPSSASAAFSKKVSSVSKKVKDTLGKVLPGSLGSSAKHFKVKEDRVPHRGQAAKAMQTPMGHGEDAIENNVNSTMSSSVTNSKSDKKKNAKVEENYQEVISTEQSGYGTVIPGLTGSSKSKVAGKSNKKGSDNPSFHSTQVSPRISRKKLGPEGSQSPSVGNANHLNGAQSSKGPSSGLRLPSPKIGFFDTPRCASGENPSTLPEKVLGSALGASNSTNSRKGLPPRPKHGLPSGRAEKPGRDGNSLAKAFSKLVSSGIPSAPHLRPSSKSVEGLARSASAATSPHSHHQGIHSSGSHQAMTGRRLSQAKSDQSNVCASEPKTQTLRIAASGASDALIFEARDCESGQLLIPSGPLEVGALPQVMKRPSGRSATYKLDAKMEGLAGDKSPCPELTSDNTSAQSAGAPESDSCLRRAISDKSMDHTGDNLGMANLDCGRSSGHDLQLKYDHKRELILDDSPNATTSSNKEVSRITPKIEDRILISSGKVATEEWVQRLRTNSPSKHPEKEGTRRLNDSWDDSQSSWSDWSRLAAPNRLSSQPSQGQEQTPPITPTFKRVSYTSNVTAEDTNYNTPESFVGSSSPGSALDAQRSKHPLAVNAGLMNGISKRTSLSASKKERNWQIDIEQSAAESTSGQENKRGLDSQVGGSQLHKPKQRKSNSSHILEQSEPYGDLFSEERLRALEAAGQESLQKKSGAVQHSPPNKTSPNRNPWSPVKKGGQHPGPFDCTKKYTNACMGQ